MARTPLTPRQNQRTSEAVRWFETHTRVPYRPAVLHRPQDASKWGIYPILFPVLLTQTGGSAGSGTAACSFTYTVADIYGTSLGTGVALAHRQAVYGKITAATSGVAYYDAAGAVILWSCNEVAATVKRSC